MSDERQAMAQKEEHDDLMSDNPRPERPVQDLSGSDPVSDLDDEDIARLIDYRPVTVTRLLFEYFTKQHLDPRNKGYPMEDRYKTLAHAALLLYMAVHGLEDGA